MSTTKEELAKEFINQTWCHFLNNSTTHEFSLLPNDSEEASSAPAITNPIIFIQNSHKTLLEDLELLATELRMTGIIDEENNFTWNEVAIPVEEENKQSQTLVSVTEEDGEEDSDDDDQVETASYISSSTSGSDNESEERAEYFDMPLRIALFRSFPPANRFSEQTLTHYIEKLTTLFTKLVKENHI
jgi:L-rhamnose mutarotase